MTSSSSLDCRRPAPAGADARPKPGSAQAADELSALRPSAREQPHLDLHRERRPRSAALPSGASLQDGERPAVRPRAAVAAGAASVDGSIVRSRRTKRPRVGDAASNAGSRRRVCWPAQRARDCVASSSASSTRSARSVRHRTSTNSASVAAAHDHAGRPRATVPTPSTKHRSLARRRGVDERPSAAGEAEKAGARRLRHRSSRCHWRRASGDSPCRARTTPPASEPAAAADESRTLVSPRDAVARLMPKPARQLALGLLKSTIGEFSVTSSKRLQEQPQAEAPEHDERRRSHQKFPPMTRPRRRRHRLARHGDAAPADVGAGGRLWRPAAASVPAGAARLPCAGRRTPRACPAAPWTPATDP